MKRLKVFLLSLIGVTLMVSCAKDKNDTPSLPGYKIIEYGDVSENTELPCFINVMFQVTDMEGNGVSTLSTNDFEVLENDAAVSPTESAMQIRKQDVIPYTLKTVLLIDNSFSVGDNLSEIKSAAKSLALSKMDNQEFAIFVFSENPELLQDFTSSTSELTSAIDNIELGMPSTNLYGSYAEAVQMWEDYYETDQIEQGFMIAFTDGSDTQGSSTLGTALTARGDKKVYMVGLGDELEPEVLEDLGNAGYYSIDDVTELADKFAEIQDEMADFANSFYWMNYMTPKRGDNDHTLRLYILNNSNTGSDSYVEGSFNSNGFYSVSQGLYINASETNPYGIDEIDIPENDTITLEATTYLGLNAPSYTWSTANNTIATLLDAGDPSNYTMQVIGNGAVNESVEITVSDLANGLQQTITVNIVENSGATEGLVAYYKFDDASAEDSWGSNDGINHGAIATADANGNSDAAIEFVSNDYIAVQPSPLATGEKSVSLMVKFGENDRRQILLANSIDSESSDAGLLIAKKENNTIQFAVGNGSDDGYYLAAQTSMTITDTEWHTIVMVYDESSIKGYIDGSLKCSSDAVTGSEQSTTLALYLGGPHTPVNKYFVGAMDEVRLYSRALTDAEAIELSGL